MEKKSIQIDVMNVVEGFAHCNLYAPDRCVKIFIPKADYEALIQDGFFIRDGKDADSANVINTTETYTFSK